MNANTYVTKIGWNSIYWFLRNGVHKFLGRTDSLTDGQLNRECLQPSTEGFLWQTHKTTTLELGIQMPISANEHRSSTSEDCKIAEWRVLQLLHVCCYDWNWSSPAPTRQLTLALRSLSAFRSNLFHKARNQTQICTIPHILVKNCVGTNEKGKKRRGKSGSKFWFPFCPSLTLPSWLEPKKLMSPCLHTASPANSRLSEGWN